MEQPKSQSWKPVVYLSVTIGGTVVVLTTLYATLRLFYRGFSLMELLRVEGEATVWAAGFIAYATVVTITWLLKRYYGRNFGTYLDDADAIELGPAPSHEKLCARCGSRFAVYRNDFHAAGFCSRACREASGNRR